MNKKEMIIATPTKELWDRVQEKMFSEGMGWVVSGKNKVDAWDKRKEESCILVGLSSEAMVGRKNTFYYRDRDFAHMFHPSIPITPAEEYLGKVVYRKEKGIIKEFNGIRVGDKVEYKVGNFIHKGYVKEIDPMSFAPYLLYLEGYGIGSHTYWNLKKDFKVLPNFSPGDKVRVKEDIELEYYEKCPFCECRWRKKMDEFKGKILILNYKTSTDKVWDVKESTYNFCEHWFEKVEEKVEEKVIMEENPIDASQIYFPHCELPKIFSTHYTKQPKISNKPKNKIMAVIRNAFKGTEKKATEHFGITNGDGGLTGTGREEFIDYLYQTRPEEKKGFIKKIVEMYKEVMKK